MVVTCVSQRRSTERDTHRENGSSSFRENGSSSFRDNGSFHRRSPAEPKALPALLIIPAEDNNLLQYQQQASRPPLQLHKQLTATTMKLSTAAAIMTISASILSLPATVTASSSKTSKQAKGGSYSMSIHPTSKASKKAKGGSYSMSVDTNSCRRKLRFNCAPFKEGLKSCDELTNSCAKGPFRFGCKPGPNKSGEEVCGRICNPGCPTIPPPFGTNPCTYAPDLECYPSNNGRPQCCADDPTGSQCSKNEPCEIEMV